MIEVKWDVATGTARQRTDYYTPEVGDIMFNNREFEPSTYDATAQSWYRRAVAENGPVWNRVSNFPGSNRQAISISTPLTINNELVAVINVVIDRARLSQFLATIEVGKSGTVVVLDRNGNVMASPDPSASSPPPSTEWQARSSWCESSRGKCCRPATSVVPG